MKFLSWVAGLRPKKELHKPSTPTPLQTQILAICQDMGSRAEAEKVNAAQLREIANSLGGVVAAPAAAEEVLQSIGIVPPPACLDAAPPTGTASLLEMVRDALGGPQDEEPRAAVLAVARWLRSVGHKFAARDLELEAGK